MSTPIQIRNVPEDVHGALKARAAERGESLNTYLVSVLSREVERPTVREVLARAASRSERSTVSSLAQLEIARSERELPARGRRR